MNTIKIFYERIKDGVEEEELSLEVEFSPVKDFIWWKEKQVIFIMWGWGQEEAVSKLLSCCEELLLGVRVVISNDSKEVANSLKEECVANATLEENEEEIGSHDSDSEIDEDTEKQDKQNVADIPKETDKNESSDVKYESKAENTLRNLLGEDKLCEYNFSAKADVEKIFSDFAIEDEKLKLAIELTYASASEEEIVRAIMAKVGGKYSQLQKDLRKAIKKWLNTYYPEFNEEHPEWEVKNFLNLFREVERRF